MTRWCAYLRRAAWALETKREGSVSSLKLTIIPSGAQPSTRLLRNLGTGSRSMISFFPAGTKLGLGLPSFFSAWVRGSSPDWILCSARRSRGTKKSETAAAK